MVTPPVALTPVARERMTSGMGILRGISVWNKGHETLAEPLSVEALASSHSLWDGFVRERGPWVEDGPWFRSQAPWEAPPLVICGLCPSSLDVARLFLEQGILPEWGAVLAVNQSSGRGQMRRPWACEPGNIYAAWRWPKPPSQWDPLLPLMVGDAVATALEDQGLPVSIKWPNDVLLNGRKVGGILVEERAGEILVGFGLNVAWAPGDETLREGWCPKASKLRDHGDFSSISDLWFGLVKHGIRCYKQSVTDGDTQSFLLRMTGRLAWIGRDVRVHSARGEYTAKVLGLAPDGGLVLTRQDGEHVLYSGSLSLI